MDGPTLVSILDGIMKERGITRNELCAEIGITSSAYSAWKNGATPKRERIAQIEKFLGIDLSDLGRPDPREGLREDLRLLLSSAEDLPPSSVYELVAEIHRRKEMGQG